MLSQYVNIQKSYESFVVQFSDFTGNRQGAKLYRGGAFVIG